MKFFHLLFSHLKNKKKIVIHFIKIILFLCSYLYVFQKINNSNLVHDFPKITTIFNVKNTTFIGIVVILMIFNWLMETIKWKILLKRIEAVSVFKSLLSVIYGVSVGVFTPARLGEVFGRIYFLENTNRISGTFAGVIGSLFQTIPTFLFGLVSCLFLLYNNKLGNMKLSTVSIFLVAASLLILIVYLTRDKLKLKRVQTYLLRKLKIENISGYFDFARNYTKMELLSILLLSTLRYFTFLIQFYFVLHILSVEISAINVMFSVSAYYFILSFVPLVALADVGIRATVAIATIGLYSNNFAAIALASFLIWFVNVGIPALVGGGVVFVSKRK